MEWRKRGEVSLAQETSEDSMNPSYFSVQPTEPPAAARGEGSALPLLQLWMGVPRLWESGLGISLLA